MKSKLISKVNKSLYFKKNQFSTKHNHFNEENRAFNELSNLLPVFQNKGWSMLHTAVLSKNIEKVDVWLKEVAPTTKANNGITPFDLAIYTRNNTIYNKLLDKCSLEQQNAILDTYIPPSDRFDSEVEILSMNDDITNILSPFFFREIAIKLKNTDWRYWFPNRFHFQKNDFTNASYYPLIKTMDSKISTPTDNAFRELFFSLTNNKLPMASAIESGDNHQIEKLIYKGWNAYFEHAAIDLSRRPSEHHFYYSLDYLYKHDQPAYRALLQQLLQANTTGVTKESEFNRLLYGFYVGYHQCPQEQALALFDLGITPESFKHETGKDLHETINWLGIFNGDRGIADLYWLQKELEERINHSKTKQLPSAEGPTFFRREYHNQDSLAKPAQIDKVKEDTITITLPEYKPK